MKLKSFVKTIFGQLIFSYIVFAILLVISFILTIFFALFLTSNGNLNSINPYEVVDQNGNLNDISSIKRLGGWVEKLDTSYNVLEVYGIKKDNKNSYTQSDIYKYLNTNNAYENLKYRGFISEVKIHEETYYYMTILERDVLNVQLNIMLSHNNLKNTDKITMVFFAFLFFLNCILISLYLSKKIKKPLKSLTLGMEKVKSGEDNVRLDFKAQGEFEEIKNTFNLMMDKLEYERNEKEKNEIKKKKMLLDLSHDIKTPITTIKTYANALEAGLVSDDKKSDYYKVIDKKSLRVSNLIDNMFTMLTLENPDYVLTKKREDMCELIREICSEYYEEINEKGLNLNLSLPEEKCYAEIDKNLFHRVVSNLIINAFKYNKTGENIWISLTKEETEIIMHFQDDGKTIEESIRNNLFEPFVRGNAARPTNEGTGLGLTISKSIIEKHNGSIDYNYIDGRNSFNIILKSIND